MKKNLVLALCILMAGLTAWSCRVSDPEEKHLISILVPDSLKSFDEMRILLLDPETRDTLDTLWNAPFLDSAQLTGLETKRYAGGPVEVVIQGRRSGELALVMLIRYQADGIKPETETVYVKPLPIDPPKTVPDTVKPVLTLTGPDSLEIVQGRSYMDLGAHCKDERDGDLPFSAKGEVNTLIRGRYQVDFDCTDSAGNPAPHRLRIINVIREPDTIPPIIALTGPDTVIAFENRPYSDSGATCRDDRDGNLPVTVGGAVDILARGDYPLVFGCADSAGNAAAGRTRIVKVVRLPDPVKPLLFLRGPDSLIVYDKETYVDSGAVCMDDRDGPIPVLVQGSVDTGLRARFILVYQCADSSGNAAVELQRVVKVERKPDPVTPILKLRGSDSLDLHQGLAYEDAGSDCTDDRDGTIVPSVTGSVDPATRGLYSLSFHCVDSAGNASDAIRKVLVVRVPDTTKPVITLRGSAWIRIPVGEAYADSGADCVDARDGIMPVTVAGGVGSAKADYVLKYGCADSAGNAADTATRTVSVIPDDDVLPPTITLAGEDTIPLVSLASFTDPGGACQDAEDGVLTLNGTGITPPGTAPGYYRVGYSCRDSAGNVGTATRTLKVGLFGTYLASMADAQIDTLSDGYNMGATGPVGMVVEPNGNYFTLVRFDMSKVVKSGLKAAKLRLFSFGHGVPWPGTYADYTFQVYRVKSDWVEGTGNWYYHRNDLRNGGETWLEHYPMSEWGKANSSDPAVESGIMGSDKDLVREANLNLVATHKLHLFFSDRNGSLNQVPPPDNLTVVELDITDYVQSADPAADYGFVIKVFGVPAGRYMDFATRDLGDGSWAPRLMLEY